MTPPNRTTIRWSNLTGRPLPRRPTFSSSTAESVTHYPEPKISSCATNRRPAVLHLDPQEEGRHQPALARLQRLLGSGQPVHLAGIGDGRLL